MAQLQHDNDWEQVCNAYLKELEDEREAYKTQVAQEKEANAHKLAQLKADTKAIL